VETLEPATSKKKAIEAKNKAAMGETRTSSRNPGPSPTRCGRRSSEARAEQAKINAAVQVRAKYIALAEGSEDIANSFFRNAYKNQPELIKAILGAEDVFFRMPGGVADSRDVAAAG
jgi:hypothetical protein